MIGRVLGGAMLAVSLWAQAFSGSARAADDPGLVAFGSATELEAFLAARGPQASGTIDPKCPPELQDECLRAGVEDIVVTGSRVASAPTITNTQEAGVDEGDIVKARGDTLVILRRGRLFSVSTAGGGLRPVDSTDAYPPGIDAAGDWYDEMLIAGDWVVVIGYSYGRGGTEINRFRMDAVGRFTFVDSHHIISADYYSSRNYASRLIGEELVLYTPVEAGAGEPLRDMPMLSRGWGDGEPVRTSIVAAENIYRAPGLDGAGAVANTLHTVVRCPLTAAELRCGGVAILGPESRNYYVAPRAVYVWMSDWNADLPKDEEPPAWLYRVPLDGSAPRAAATRGVPIDQFSFREDPDGRDISVMVVSQGRGEGMWGAEAARGRAALLTLPFERFGDGLDDPENDDYRIVPALRDGWEARNRFVGEHLLYSSTIYNAGWRADEEDEAAPEREGLLTVVPLREGPVVRFVLPGKIGRIEEIGRDAMILSDDEDIVFTTLALTGSRPVISDQFVIPGATEAENRSHAFYFLPDRDSADGSRGVMGLPVFRDAGDEGARSDDRGRIGAVAFMRRGGGRLGDLGSLDATPEISNVDDGCLASCYSWYGDARPIFLGGRVFALLGYELVEGRERDGRMREVRRIDLTPPPPPGPRPYYPD